MSVNHAKTGRWKLVLNVVTVLALALLIYISRDQVVETLGNIKQVNGWFLLLLIPIEVLNYHSQTRLYQRLFSMVGTKISYWYLFRTALELNFVNNVFPSGGAAGISYFGTKVRKGSEVTAGKAALVHLIKLAATFISLELIIVLGLLCLAAVGRVNQLLLLVTVSLSTVVLLVTAAIPYIVGSQRRINTLITWLTRLINKIIHIVRPKNPETINIGKAKAALTDFHNNYRQLKSNWRELRAPFWYALLSNATEIAAVYTVYLAFGSPVNVGAVILAYAVANFAGLISVLPGGVGVYEALMVAVMASAGIPPGISLPVTVMFRVLTSLIQLPPGYYFYQQTLRRNQLSPEVA